jgi:CHAT domain-containing protein
MKIFEPKNFLHLQLLARAIHSGNISLNDAVANEALKLFQWRDAGRAGRALVRTAARAVLPVQLASKAVTLDRAVVRWRNTQQQLIEKQIAGESQSVAELTSELSRTLDTALSSYGTLAARSSLYQRLTQNGLLSLADIRKVLKRSEAIIHFALSDLGESIALVITTHGISLMELTRPKDSDELPISELMKRMRSSILENAQYDFTSAHKLYHLLFEPLKPSLEGIKELIIVPDVAFTSLPFPALVSRLPVNSIGPEWLVQSYAFTMSPSLSSFVALRSRPESPSGTTPFVGFSNPAIQVALDTCSSYSAWGTQRPSVGLCPVPETLDQVAALANGLGVDPNTAAFSGPEFTLTKITEKLSSPVRIAAFATHGLTSEESARQFGVSEPALLLSSQPMGGRYSEWLTTSKIEQLSIDIDLVVLSACNTAAGQGASGEALSGLARAFFEAGARGILVSNWYVDAGETRALLSDISDGLRKSERSFSTILQQAMLARLKTNSSPRDWAMFSYIGR